jgi:hypothetical protein
MKRICTTVIFAICLIVLIVPLAKAQFASEETDKIRLSGEIIDEEEGNTVPYVTIANINQQLMTVSDEEGKFSITFDRNDTLEFSALGFDKYRLTLKDSLSSDEFYIKIALSQKTYELKEVSVYAYKDEESFKKAVLEMELPKEEEHAPIRIPGAYYGPKRPASATGPISFITQKFGKQARFEKKLQQIREEYEYSKEVNQKFNRELVAEATGLTDEVLDQFIIFCKMEDDFITKANEYEILVAIDECYSEFKEKGLGEN